MKNKIDLVNYCLSIIGNSGEIFPSKVIKREGTKFIKEVKPDNVVLTFLGETDTHLIAALEIFNAETPIAVIEIPKEKR